MLAHLATFAGTPCHFASDDGARLYDLSRLRRLPHEFDLIVYNFRVNGADAQFRMNVCADVNAPCEAGAHPGVSTAVNIVGAGPRLRVRRPKLTECGLLYCDMAADMKAARDFASFDGSSAGSTIAAAAA